MDSGTERAAPVACVGDSEPIVGSVRFKHLGESWNTVQSSVFLCWPGVGAKKEAVRGRGSQQKPGHNCLRAAATGGPVILLPAGPHTTEWLLSYGICTKHRSYSAQAGRADYTGLIKLRQRK